MPSITSANDFTNATDTSRSKAYKLVFVLASLKANTQFSFFWNGVDMSFACRPKGGRMGDSLISNQNGKLLFWFYYQRDYTDNKSFDNSAVTKTSSSPQVITQQNFFELKGAGGAYGSGYVPFNQLVKPVVQAN